MAPSRQFLVQQAVLNVAAEWYPVSARRGDLREVLGGYAETLANCGPFQRDVHHEYRALAARYAQ